MILAGCDAAFDLMLGKGRELCAVLTCVEAWVWVGGSVCSTFGTGCAYSVLSPYGGNDL